HRTTGGLLQHVAVLIEPAEQLLHDRVVVAGGGAGEKIVGQAQAHEVLDDDAVVAVGELADRGVFLIRLHQQRGAVLVRAGDHQHVVADHSLITGKNVGRDAEAGDVADVAGAVGIGPGNRGEYAL